MARTQLGRVLQDQLVDGWTQRLTERLDGAGLGMPA